MLRGKFESFLSNPGQCSDVTENRKPSFARVFYSHFASDDLTVQGLGASKARRKSGALRSIVLISLVGLAGWGILMVAEAALNPWSLSLTGGPTLAGEWFGEMTTPTGKRRIVRLVVDRSGLPDITGKALWCDGGQNIQEHELWGNPENWRGTRFSAKTRKAYDLPLELRPGDLHGEWEGDTLRLTTTLRSDTYNYSMQIKRDEAGNETTKKIGAHPDTLSSVTFLLLRGVEEDFRRACERLKP